MFQILQRSLKPISNNNNNKVLLKPQSQILTICIHHQPNKSMKPTQVFKRVYLSQGVHVRAAIIINSKIPIPKNISSGLPKKNMSLIKNLMETTRVLRFTKYIVNLFDRTAVKLADSTRLLGMTITLMISNLFYLIPRRLLPQGLNWVARKIRL